jgi:hypothetical protein
MSGVEQAGAGTAALPNFTEPTTGYWQTLLPGWPEGEPRGGG